MAIPTPTPMPAFAPDDNTGEFECEFEYGVAVGLQAKEFPVHELWIVGLASVALGLGASKVQGQELVIIGREDDAKVGAEPRGSIVWYRIETPNALIAECVVKVDTNTDVMAEESPEFVTIVVRVNTENQGENFL